MALRIAYAVARQIADHALAESPREACGLIAGDGAMIRLALPLENQSAAPNSRFAPCPGQQLRALKTIDQAGLRWIGVYHSHPAAAALPSRLDIAESRDPALLQLIVSLQDEKPALKLWRVARQEIEPVDLLFEAGEVDDSSPLSDGSRIAILAAGLASLLLLLALSFSLLPAPPTP